MRDTVTAEEIIDACMTVGELVDALSKLPQDARLIKAAGGDCDGYVPISKKELTLVTAGVRNDINTNDYRGAFDLIEKRRVYDYVGYIKKFKAVRL